MDTMRITTLAAAFLMTAGAAAFTPVGAQTPQKPFDFSIKNIMRGPELYGRAPSNVRWTQDGKWIYFSGLEPGADFRETVKPFRVRAVAGAKPERVSAAHMDTVGPLLVRGEKSVDGRSALVEYRG